MKKLFVLLLVALMALSLIGSSACKPAASPTGGEESAWKLNKDGVLTVALSPDFAPMEFVDSSKSGQEQYVGFDITLAKYIAAELGVKLEVKPMSFDACQTAVQLGTVDMSISGFSWTAEREQNFAISDYYIAGDNETEQVIIVAADKAGSMTTADAFSGLKVAAQAASLQELLCNQALPENIELTLFKDINDAVLALKTGKVDAIAVAHGNGEAIIANNPEIGFSGFQFDVDPKYENNVILLNKANTALLLKVNEILAKAMAANLYDGWYNDAKELAGIPSAAEVGYDEEGNVVEG